RLDGLGVEKRVQLGDGKIEALLRGGAARNREVHLPELRTSDMPCMLALRSLRGNRRCAACDERCSEQADQICPPSHGRPPPSAALVVCACSGLGDLYP